jgi:outer membrane protein assembly factor BamB
MKSSLVTPTIHNDVLYFMEGVSRPTPTLAQSEQTTIHALDLRSKQIKWSFKAKGIFDTPAISDTMMFVGSNRDYLYAIDLGSGAEKWRVKAEARAPATRDGVVYFSDSSNLYAVAAESGAAKWKIKIPGGVDQALAISKSRIFFSNRSKQFYAVELSDGSVAWSVKARMDPFEPIIGGERVFVGGKEELMMLEAETGKKHETVILGKDIIAYTPVLIDKQAIIYNGDGYFFAVKK